MKFTILLTIMAAGALAGPLHARQNKGKAGKAAAAKGNGNAAAATGAVTKGATTLVFKEDGGVPGNECLTFRNNGEIVDAACVDTAADRQITPSTLNGQNVLLVQRSFTAGFRADLVGKQACVGNNGTTFLAQDCATATDFVTFDDASGQLVSAAGACQSGHDDAAQLTIDTTGKNCATLTTTSVTATAP
ncbi:hypothetical protein N0V93_008817 [Gnomoniopsis smithogilvyi]|uniref:Ricin B lectin domain-containing protein n=1 Tax=Gnomoniopsis smithogilvyi TaxID=1191159 RepID=A0A9W8YQR2_9PEZI|nr:hypothetical protein N0V93_008817 [Gnomoniopsis smithogilvyi]